MGSLVFLPVWMMMVLSFEPVLVRKWKGCLLGLIAFMLPGSVVLTQVWGDLGLAGFGFNLPPQGWQVVMHGMLHDVFPPPLLILLLIALWRLRRDWDELAASERMLCVMAVLLVVTGLGINLLGSGDYRSLTVILPAVMALCGILVSPRYLAVGLPILAIWGVVSFPVVPSHPAQSVQPLLKPTMGPLVEEMDLRFEKMRAAQQLLLFSSKKNTVFVVGEEWFRLAVLHPGWISQNEILKKPDKSVEYHTWVDRETFLRLKAEGYRFYTVGDAGHQNRARFGYDLFEEGTMAWHP
jgi:hypothetical protein